MDGSNHDSQPAQRGERDDFSDKIETKARRKLKAKSEPRSIWFGMGMFGVVGWAVATPTLLGIAVGVWIGQRWPSRFSWTLMLLFIGVVLGCLNAWFWVSQEGPCARPQ